MLISERTRHAIVLHKDNDNCQHVINTLVKIDCHFHNHFTV